MARTTRYRLLRFAALLLLALMVGLLQGTALANSGPPRYQGDTGGPLLPGKSDQVHVVSEQLSFALNEEFRAAEVTARYELENRGPALADQPFVFVVQARGDDLNLTASWRGEPVPVEQVDVAQFTAEQLQKMEAGWTSVDVWLDPVTGEPYTDAHFYGTTGLRYFRFAIDLPAGVNGELQVSYTHAGAYDRTLHAHTVYHYQYLLLPAQGWASFGPLEIRVSAPEGTRYYFASNLDFDRVDGAYLAEFPGLPEENLAFAVMDRTGLIFGLTQPGPYYWFAFIVVLFISAAIGLGIGWFATRLPTRRWSLVVGVLGGLLLGGALDVTLAVAILAAMPALREQTYGIYIVGFGQGLAGAVLTGVVARFAVKRIWRRQDEIIE